MIEMTNEQMMLLIVMLLFAAVLGFIFKLEYFASMMFGGAVTALIILAMA